MRRWDRYARIIAKCVPGGLSEPGDERLSELEGHDCDKPKESTTLLRGTESLAIQMGLNPFDQSHGNVCFTA